MIWSYVFGASTGFIMVITLAFNLGNIAEIITTPTGYPFIQILYNTTGSLAATNVLVSVSRRIMCPEHRESLMRILRLAGDVCAN